MPDSGDECRPRQAQRVGAFREVGEHVERGQRRRGVLQHGNRGRQVVQQPLEQPLLARERALLRGQRLVLERLQFRRDVALGVLQRLPAAVVVGNLLDVRVGDFDVEAVHAVVLDLEIGDAGAFALARLQRHEELAAVRVDRAQLVQFGVESGRDHAAVADQRRGLGRDCPREQRRPLRVDIEAAGRGAQQRRVDGRRRRAQVGQPGQRVAQARKIARPRVAQRDAADDALDVDGLLQARDERAGNGSVATQHVRDVVPGRRLCLRPQRLRQPDTQQSAAGRGGAAVEQREQRRRGVARQGRGDLQVASRRGIERHVFAGRLDVQRADVGERRHLRRARVVQQRACGTDRQWRLIHAEGSEIEGAELFGQRLCCRGGVEFPRCERTHGRHAAAQRGRRRFARHEQFGRDDAFEHARGLGQGNLGQRERTGREIEPCDSGALPLRQECREQAVALGVEQIGVGERPRRDDACDAPLHRPLARRRIAELLDDDDRFAMLHELGQVRLERVVRHASHGDGRACRLSARRQRDVEQPRSMLGVGVEEFVEVAHPVEDELVRMLRLGAQVLLHHRRVGREGGVAGQAVVHRSGL